MTLDTPLFALTLLAYLLASVSYHVHLFAGSDRARAVSVALVPVGVALHTAAIGAWCTAHGPRLLSDAAMPFSLVAYFLAIVQTAANLRRSWASLGSLSLPIAFFFQFFASLRMPESGLEVPTSNPVLRPHVMVLLLGFSAFALSFCLAVLYLVQSRMLKTKNVRGLIRRLPPLESVGTAAHWLVTVGFSMLTFGVITGAMVAPASWGPTWYLDPRLLTALVAWGIYAAYLGFSLFAGWRGRRTTYFLIAGFLVVLVAFIFSVSRPRGV